MERQSDHGNFEAGVGDVSFEIDRAEGPKEVRLCSDDYHLNTFGVTKDDCVVWTGYQLSYDHPTGETTDFVFKFLFDLAGKLTSSEVQTLGIRGSYDRELSRKIMSSLSRADTVVKTADVMIQTFSILHDGCEFGLIANPPENEDDVWRVTFMPGNTIAFFSPFDDGLYDT